MNILRYYLAILCLKVDKLLLSGLVILLQIHSYIFLLGICGNNFITKFSIDTN